MNRNTLGLPVHHQLREFTQTHFHWVSDAIQPSHPLLSPSPPAPNPSQHQSLFDESTLRMRWPKYWSFSFSIIPSKEIPGPIFFRMDWLYLLAVQGTLKSLLQHHSSKASILWRLAFFTVQLSHPYRTTGKTIAFVNILPHYSLSFSLLPCPPLLCSSSSPSSSPSLLLLLASLLSLSTHTHPNTHTDTHTYISGYGSREIFILTISLLLHVCVYILLKRRMFLFVFTLELKLWGCIRLKEKERFTEDDNFTVNKGWK